MTGYIRGDVRGLRLWGPDAQQFFVTTVDADGNTILGPGRTVHYRGVQRDNARRFQKIGECRRDPDFNVWISSGRYSGAR